MIWDRSWYKITRPLTERVRSIHMVASQEGFGMFFVMPTMHGTLCTTCDFLYGIHRCVHVFCIFQNHASFGEGILTPIRGRCSWCSCWWCSCTELHIWKIAVSRSAAGKAEAGDVGWSCSRWEGFRVFQKLRSSKWSSSGHVGCFWCHLKKTEVTYVQNHPPRKSRGDLRHQMDLVTCGTRTHEQQRPLAAGQPFPAVSIA